LSIFFISVNKSVFSIQAYGRELKAIFAITCEVAVPSLLSIDVIMFSTIWFFYARPLNKLLIPLNASDLYPNDYWYFSCCLGVNFLPEFFLSSAFSITSQDAQYILIKFDI
jgi:hypothetical protein